MRYTFASSPSVITGAEGRTVKVYLDETLLTLADIQTVAGAAIVGSSLVLDAESDIPDFLGPDGVRTLYAALGKIAVQMTARIAKLPVSTGSGGGASPWDATKAYPANSQVVFNGTIYSTATATTAGASPPAAPWTVLVKGGLKTPVAWDAVTSYAAEDTVLYRGGLYQARSTTVAIPPHPLEAPYSEVRAGGPTNAVATLGQSTMGIAFTPTAAMTVNTIRVFHGVAGSYVNTSVGFSLGFGASYSLFAQSPLVSITTTLGSYTDHTFATPVNLTAGVKVWLAFIQMPSAGYVGVAPGAVTGGTTTDTVRYGATLETAWVAYSMTWQMRGPTQANTWAPIAPGQTMSAVLGGSYFGPSDAGLIVGSDRYDRDPADTSKNARMFFNKLKKAFRAGSAANDEWDDVNVGLNSAALGANAQAKGSDSFAVGRGSNSQGTDGMAMGQFSQASNTSSTAVGASSTAAGAYSSAFGYNAYAGAQYSSALGVNSQASGNYSTALGYQGRSERYNGVAFGGGNFSNIGDCISHLLHFRGITTTATPLILTADAGALNVAVAQINTLSITINRAMRVRIQTIARRTDVAGEVAGWSWDGVIARDATNIRIVGTPVEKTWGDTAAAAWVVGYVLDTVNQSLNVQATGEAAKTIRWHAEIRTVEVAS